MNNLGMEELVKLLRILNKGAYFRQENSMVILGSKPIEKLKVPQPYYVNNKMQITNKGQTDGGWYQWFEYVYCDDLKLYQKDQKVTVISSLINKFISLFNNFKL